MKAFSPILIVALTWGISAGFASSQIQTTPLASYDDVNHVLRLDWESPRKRTFFPQVSTDLVTWDYIGALQFGPGSHAGMIQSSAEKTFAKLRYSDLPVASEPEAGSADFDLDGLSNIEELEDSHTDPLDADTDKDGLPDGWEVAHGISPLDDGSVDIANGPDGEFGGGSGGGGGFSTFSITTNGAAFSAGVAATPTATFEDLDGDGLANARDAGPASYAIDWETDGAPAKFFFMPIPDYVYATHGGILGCNDLGDILTEKAVYSGGAWHFLAQIAVNQPNFLGSKIRVDAKDHDTYVKFQPSPTSISNDGKIVGYAMVYSEPISEQVAPGEWETYYAASTPLAFVWDSWSATPRLLAHAANSVINGDSWDEYPQIAGDGSVTVRRRTAPTAPSNTAYSFDRYTTSGSSTTPSYPTALPAVMGNSGFLTFNEGSANAYSWMPGAAPVSVLADSFFSTPNPRNTFQQFSEPTYLGEKPGPAGGYCINFWGKAMIRKDGRWRQGHEMGDATLVTTNGVAFRARNPSAVQVWKNGNTVQSLNDAVLNKSFTGLYTFMVDSTSDGSALISFYGSGQNSYGFLVPIDIQQVISDQLADIEVNKLPSPYFGGQAEQPPDPNNPCATGGGYGNNPMSMGTRADGVAYVKMRVNVGGNPSMPVPDQLLVGMRVVADRGHPTEAATRGAVKPNRAPDLTFLSFDPLTEVSTVLPRYEAVYGWDANSDGKLQTAEVAGAFQKTPLIDATGAPSVQDTEIADLIRIATPLHVDTSVALLYTSTFGVGYQYAEDLLASFVTGDKTHVTSNSHVSESATTVMANEVSHPVGLAFDSSGEGATHQFNFDKDSEVAEDAYAGIGLERFIKQLANEKLEQIIAAAPANPGEHSYYLAEISPGSSICFSGEYKDYLVEPPTGDSRLFVSIKKAEITGGILFRIDRYYTDGTETAQKLEISWDEIDSTVSDVYDFVNSADILPRSASIVQAGSLGATPRGRPCRTQATLKRDPLPQRFLVILL